jgi:hypothetical protein|uniref:Uncharacterized protein n=1 Tax=Podoviridae sp. ctXdu7 TaxID=2827618 RepID=A0A8S5RS36_9CAUD|nr:MAG TPA: hypothetical protein [Podoviridae sp. ctXdu7]
MTENTKQPKTNKNTKPSRKQILKRLDKEINQKRKEYWKNQVEEITISFLDWVF